MENAVYRKAGRGLILSWAIQGFTQNITAVAQKELFTLFAFLPKNSLAEVRYH